MTCDAAPLQPRGDVGESGAPPDRITRTTEEHAVETVRDHHLRQQGGSVKITDFIGNRQTVLFRWTELQRADGFTGKEDFEHPGHELLIPGGEDDHLEGVIVQNEVADR